MRCPSRSSCFGAAPDLHILTTSRQALGVAGETTWTVPPLSLPDPLQVDSVQHVLSCEAGRLFVDRALAVRSNLEVSDVSARS